MKRNLIILSLLSFNLLSAIPPENAIETNDYPRITSLLPCGYYCLPIEPAIPNNFIAMSETGKLNLQDWIYWGPQEVIEDFFKSDKKQLKSPIIRIKLSGNVFQTGPESFGPAKDLAIVEQMKKNPEQYNLIQKKIGDYPVIAFTNKIGNHAVTTGWIGLNDPEGLVLLCNLVCPSLDKEPSKEDLKLWNAFLNESTPLVDSEKFKAIGQNLKPGYTLLNLEGSRAKMTAEKRKSDGKIQVVLIPISKDINFQLNEIQECLLGSNWNFMAPLCKVYGKFTKTESAKCKVIIPYVTSILLDEVEDFSISKEEASLRKDLFVFQN
ncbi:hypothetical protein BN1013_00118 [Candidatus Rubidus massiliensis]|nr:MAG: hypothetical protein BGO10_07545 [Chlamydia sp. 32-24]CDZ79623.1 hypothetical protein BN1013_00118 [Candidatus Rubidus massiliensis]